MVKADKAVKLISERKKNRMPVIPEDFIEKVRTSVDISDVVGKYIQLRKAGSDFKALCPFHHEKTPSFMVSPAKGIYKCFGCGAGGNVFNFLMQLKGVSFIEAVEDVAGGLGLSVPRSSGGKPVKRGLKEGLRAANIIAREFFSVQLRQTTGAIAQAHLADRGITEETIKNFSIGYAPDEWDGFIHFARRKGCDANTLFEAGLVSEKKRGGHYDRFRNRLMIPIDDYDGRPIAFGGRVLKKGDEPKYLNSPETPLFIKAQTVFGLNKARDTIKSEGKVFITEGFFDCISLHQAGITNSVAALGTAFGIKHAGVLRRLCSQLIFIFDPDMAGRKSSLRALDLLVDEPVDVKVIALPDGLDPDQYIRKFGRDAFMKMVESAKTPFQFRLEEALAKHGTGSSEHKIRVLNDLFGPLAKIVNRVFIGDQLHYFADVLNLDLNDVKSEFNRFRTGAVSRPGTQPARRKMEKDFSGALEQLCHILLNNPKLINEYKSKIPENYVKIPEISSILTLLLEKAEKNDLDPTSWLNNDLDDLTGQEITRILAISVEYDDPARALENILSFLELEIIEIKKNKLRSELKEAQNRGNKTLLETIASDLYVLNKEELALKSTRLKKHPKPVG
jgi:DNA primase